MSLGEAVAGKGGGAELRPGVVESVTDGVLMVRIGGNVLECLCMTNFSPLQGDPVLVGKFGGSAWVLGSPRRVPTPATCTVISTTVAGHPDLITVEDSSGIEYDVPFSADYTPTVNDVVAMDWQTTVGYATGVRGTVAGSFPGFNPGLPGAPASGANTFPALDAGTWRSGWENDSYGVRQGDWGGYGQNYGAWFYGGAPQQQLAGATVLSAAIYLPRLRGGVNAGQTLHLYRHTSNSRPGGDVTRVDGPYDVTSPPTNQTQWVPISTTLVQNILIGGEGGIGIAGDPYVTLAGRSADPMTGAIQITWNR